MKQIKLFSLFLVLSFLSSALFPFIKVSAKEQPYLKTANLRWNLKPNKTISFQTYYDGYGFIKVKAKVKDFIVTDAEEDGFKKATFKIEYKIPKLKISKEKASELKENHHGFLYMWTILDYNTGISLETENDLGVNISYSKWLESAEEYSYPSKEEDNPLILKKSIMKKVEVTYPKNFKRLCLMVGGSTDPTYDGNQFWNGDTPLKDTPFYDKKRKDLSSFMRIK